MATTSIELKPWGVPNYATAFHGATEEISIPVSELSQEALDDMAEQWLCDLYEHAKKPMPKLDRENRK